MRAPVCPQPHFPSPYARPTLGPTKARKVATADGALLAVYLYEPDPQPCEAQADALDEKDVVLMLHGNGEEHGIFGPMIDAAVAAGHPVVALDSRGQGKSSRGTARLTYELMADDALLALEAMGVARAHVLGFSDGAIEGLLLARDHPNAVLSLLSIGANLTPEGVVEEDDWDMLGAIAALEDWAVWAEANADGNELDGTLFSPTAAEARAQAELLRLMTVEPHIEAASLEKITCPVTVMVGENDCIAPAETTAIVAGLRQGGNMQVKLIVVPEAEHTLPKHEPEAVTQAMLELIGA